MKRRPYQIAGLQAMRRLRSFFLLWRRQGGKSTVLSEGAIDEMMGTRGRLVTYASASLLLGREIVLKESQVMQAAIRAFQERQDKAGVILETANAATHKGVPNDLGIDDFAELFENQRLEFRLWHDNTTYSRTQVIAPNPATARGWSGTVVLDEFGFIPDFRDLWEALEPIISSDRSFKFIGATTPPKDDAHYSYELTAAPLGTQFPVSPVGNWYTSELGEFIHRVDIFDAYAAGQKLFDRRTGAELTPEDHYRRANDKDAWRRNYKVEHVLGGTAACGIIELQTAQARGVGKCAFVEVIEDSDFDQAIEFLKVNLHPEAPIGLGVDLATTQKEDSNPTAFSIAERHGVEFIVRAIVAWKTKDPAIAKERFRRLIQTVRARGTPARRLCIDATNERYFATECQQELRALIPVELVVGSESASIPGSDEALNMKTLLGDQLVAELNDNHLTLPPEKYVKEDWRLVRKNRGLYETAVDSSGRHGDTFDSTKNALRALTTGGPLVMRTVVAQRPVSPTGGVPL